MWPCDSSSSRVVLVASRWEDPVQAVLAGSQVTSGTHAGLYLRRSDIGWQYSKSIYTACFIVWQPRRAADTSTNWRQSLFCCCTASMEQATDGAEIAAIDGLLLSWSWNIFVSFCLWAPGYGLTLWCTLSLLVGGAIQMPQLQFLNSSFCHTAVCHVCPFFDIISLIVPLYPQGCKVLNFLWNSINGVRKFRTPDFFQQWKNFQNQLTVDKVITKSLTPRFFRDTV